MNFGTINQIACQNVPQPVSPECSDPAFALANPGVCPADTLILKPGSALCCLLGSIQYSAILVVNGAETDVTSETTFSTSNPEVVIIGSSSGNATGVSGGTATISGLYEDDSGNIRVASASLDVLGEENCCGEIQTAIMVLVDVSYSMSQLFGGTYATKLDYAKAAASQFIAQMNGNKDLVGLMSFYDGYDTVLSTPSSSPSTVAALVPGIAQGVELTGFNKALQDAITQLNGTAANEQVILIISDGQDTSTFDPTDNSDSITTANAFKASGGFIMCLGCRSAGNDFLLLEALSTGGMFVNGYPSVASSALNYLYDLKGYVCAGNCVPAGDDYVPTPQLHYCAFNNWRVYDGQVDLIGDGLDDFLPGNGLYVNLFGSSNVVVAPVGARYTPGQLFSKSSFALQSGHVYRLSFSLAGNQVNDVSQSALFKVFGLNSDGLANPAIAPDVAVNESGAALSQTPTYKYVYTYLNANGETLQSPSASATPTTAGASMVVTPTANLDASSINVYRTTGQTPDSPYYLIATLTGSAISYTDYMNESDMLAALSAGTIDDCQTPPSINTSSTEIPLLTQVVSVTDYQQPFITYSFTFTAPNDVQAWISAQQTIPASSALGMNHGLLLDNVSFSDTTNLETLLTDNFDTENSIYVPPACGTGSVYTSTGATNVSVPLMTSNNTPSGIASDSGGDSTAYSAFAGYLPIWEVGGLAPAIVSLEGNGAWIQYEFTSAITPTSYMMSLQQTGSDEGQGQYPTAWALQASNDGLTWTTLDTHSGDSYFNTGTDAKPVSQTYSLSGGIAYSYFRITFSAWNTVTSLGSYLCAIQFNGTQAAYGYSTGYNCSGYGCINSGPLPVQVSDPNPLPNIEAGYTPPIVYNSTQQECVGCPSGYTNIGTYSNSFVNLIPAMTSYTAPSGTVSSSQEPTEYESWRAFDGNPTDTWGYNDGTNGITLPAWIQYEFPTATLINVYAFYQGPLETFPRSWTFQGSNDGSTWTTLDTQTGYQGQSGTANVFPISNATAYQFYRINVTEANNSTITSMSGIKMGVVSSAPQQACATASATSTISQQDAINQATAAATTQAQSQLNCVPSYTATENATATCPVGTAGTPNSVTESATYTSLISLTDAQNQASALAQAAATEALVNSNCTCASTNGNKLIINAAPENSNTAAAATPYPSVKCVSGLTGVITKVTVSVNGLFTTSNFDVILLLQAPDGTTVELMGYCGVPATGSFSNVLFDDAAGSSIPCSGNPPIPPMVPGPSYPNTVNTCPPPSGATVSTFKPTQCGLELPSAPASAPQPSLPYQTTLASLIGKNPNGTWSLWVFNFSAGDSGSICSWDLNISSS